MRNIDTDLYNEYLSLCERNPEFHECIQTIENPEGKYTLHSFKYRLSSYASFLDPLALEARGITFIKEVETDAISLFARPFEKFFNYGENPFTDPKIVDNLKPLCIYDKVDGSLIMVGRLPNGELLAKTQSTCLSDQAIRATRMINSNENYTEFCNACVDAGHTPLFEYTSPDNQIVIFSPTEKLILLGIRDMSTGDYLDIYDLAVNGKDFESFNIPVVKRYDADMEFVKKSMEEHTDREGYVIVFNNGLRVKFKTLDYVKKHHCRENITSDKHLSELVLSGGLDDVLPLFKENKDLVNHIKYKADRYKSRYLQIVEGISLFYDMYKDLDRKEYCIKATNMLGDKKGLAISLFLERDPNFKEYFMRNKLYEGISGKDEKIWRV